MVWWRRKKLKIETFWFRMVKFFYSFQANNYRKENYFFNATMVNVKEANRKSIDPSDAIVKCSFKDKDYLLHSSDEFNSKLCPQIWCLGARPRQFYILYSSEPKSKWFIYRYRSKCWRYNDPTSVKFSLSRFLVYEAHPTVFQALKTNIKLNSLDNICCVNGAVSNRANGTKLKFYAQRSMLII